MSTPDSEAEPFHAAWSMSVLIQCNEGHFIFKSILEPVKATAAGDVVGVEWRSERDTTPSCYYGMSAVRAHVFKAILLQLLMCAYDVLLIPKECGNRSLVTLVSSYMIAQ